MATIACALAGPCESAAGARGLQNVSAGASSAPALPPAALPPPASPVTALPLLTPQATHTFPPGVEVQAVIAAPDGLGVYVLTETPAINIWALIVYWSPEILCALAAIALLLLMRRVGKRAQLAGQPHCRKCNYALVNLDGAANCPECGHLLGRRGRMKGQPRARQIAVLIGLLALYAALYGSDGLSLMRYSDAAGWFHWCSPKLWQIAVNNKWHRFFRGSDPVATVQLFDGLAQPVRTVFRRGGIQAEGLDVSSDGSTLLLWSPIELCAIDAATGTTIRRIHVRNSPPIWSVQDARLTDDGATMLLQSWPDQIYAWGLGSERPTAIVSPDIMPRYLHFLPRAASPNAAVGLCYSHPPRLLIFATDGSYRTIATTAVTPAALAPDLSRFYDTRANGIDVYDVDGRLERSIHFQLPVYTLAVSRDDRWLAGNANGTYVIHSIADNAWVGHLPLGFWPNKVAFVEDRAALLAVGLVGVTATVRQLKLDSYDLSALTVSTPSNR